MHLPHLRIVVLTVLSQLPLQYVDAASAAHVVKSVSITIGQQQTSIPAATPIHILSQHGDEAIVSLTLSDGTSVITEIPQESLQLDSPSPPAPVATATNSVVPAAPPVTSAAPKELPQLPPPKAISPPAQGQAPALAAAAPVPSPARPPPATIVSGITKPPAPPPVPPPTPLPEGTLSADQIKKLLGDPVTLEQPDFPEPDPNFVPTGGSIDLDDHPEAQNKVQLVYNIPLDAKGKPGPRAKYIVFVCPFLNQTDVLNDDITRFLCGNLGLTVATVEIMWGAPATGAAPNSSPDQLTGSYYENDELYGALAVKAQSVIEKKYSLPKQKLILFGESSGSDMAELTALTYPAQVGTVILTGLGAYKAPTQRLDQSWLDIYVRGDGNGESNDQLIRALRNTGNRVAFLKSEPIWSSRNMGSNFHHVLSDDALKVGEGYVWDTVQLLDQGDGKSAAPSQFTAAANENVNVYGNKDGLMDSLPGDYFTLPGEASAYYFNKVKGIGAQPLVAITEYSNRLWFIEPSSTPKGIVLYNIKSDLSKLPQIVDDMYYLADNGYVVLLPRRGLDSDTYPNINNWLQSRPDLRGLPLNVVAFGDQGESTLKLAQNELKDKLHGLMFINYVFRDNADFVDLRQPGANCPTEFAFQPKLAGLSVERFGRIKELISERRSDSDNGSCAFLQDMDPDDAAREQVVVEAIDHFFEGIPASVTDNNP